MGNKWLWMFPVQSSAGSMSSIGDKIENPGSSAFINGPWFDHSAM